MSSQIDEKTQVRQKIKIVYLSYCKWFIGSALLAFFASIAAYWVNLHPFWTALEIRIIQIVSLLPEAAALGQCGYNIQTWGGESPAEKLNSRLFAILSAIGFFLIVFSFQLETLIS